MCLEISTVKHSDREQSYNELMLTVKELNFHSNASGYISFCKLDRYNKFRLYKKNTKKINHPWHLVISFFNQSKTSARFCVPLIAIF